MFFILFLLFSTAIYSSEIISSYNYENSSKYTLDHSQEWDKYYKQEKKILNEYLHNDKDFINEILHSHNNYIRISSKLKIDSDFLLPEDILFFFSNKDKYTIIHFSDSMKKNRNVYLIWKNSNKIPVYSFDTIENKLNKDPFLPEGINKLKEIYSEIDPITKELDFAIPKGNPLTQDEIPKLPKNNIESNEDYWSRIFDHQSEILLENAKKANFDTHLLKQGLLFYKKQILTKNYKMHNVWKYPIPSCIIFSTHKGEPVLGMEFKDIYWLNQPVLFSLWVPSLNTIFWERYG